MPAARIIGIFESENRGIFQKWKNKNRGYKLPPQLYPCDKPSLG